jgi:hypothetical protein
MRYGCDVVQWKEILRINELVALSVTTVVAIIVARTLVCLVLLHYPIYWHSVKC